MTPGRRGAPPDPMRTERMDLLFVGVTTAGLVLAVAAVLALVFGVPLFERRSAPGEAAGGPVPGASPSEGLEEAAPVVPPPLPSEGEAEEPAVPSGADEADELRAR